MTHNSLIPNLALVAALAITVPVFAKPVMRSLPVTHDMKVGKVDVKAGDYRAMIDDHHITLLSGKKVLAESAGHWETRDKKSPYTEILNDANGRVLELRFAGKAEVFVLSE